MSTTVTVEILARIDGVETFDLGTAECDEANSIQTITELLRTAADQLERRRQP